MQNVIRVFAATTIFLASVSPFVPCSAQTTGVGDDEETSLMWKGFDSSVALWRLDPTLTSVVASQSYGPYIGYTPIALTTDTYSNSHVVWSYTDGSIALWTLDPSMNFISSEGFGPYSGWNIVGLSADPIYGTIRLVWKNTNGALSIWLVDSDGVNDTDITLGPLAGYAPALRRRAASTAGHKGRQPPSDRYYARGKPAREAAAAAMEAHRKAVLSRAAHPAGRSL